LPYQDEVGDDPDFAIMYLNVCDLKRRPLMAPHWKENEVGSNRLIDWLIDWLISMRVFSQKSVVFFFPSQWTLWWNWLRNAGTRIRPLAWRLSMSRRSWGRIFEDILKVLACIGRQFSGRDEVGLFISNLGIQISPAAKYSVDLFLLLFCTFTCCLNVSTCGFF
jgi:hypothetical protein